MTAGALGGGSRRLLARPAARRTGAAIWVLVGIVLVENAARLSIPFLVKEGIDPGIPPIQRHGDPSRCSSIVGAGAGRDARSRRSPATCSSSGPGRIGQDVLFEVRRRVFRHFQAPQPGVPRRLHLGPGDLPADLRRRRDLRDARDRLRRPGHRRAHPGRHRRRCCSSSTSSSALVALLLRAVPALADQLVPQGVRQELPGHPREGRAGDRPLRRVDERHPRGPGVPPRAAQPGDLRRRQRPVPRAPTCAPSGWSPGSCPASG